MKLLKKPGPRHSQGPQALCGKKKLKSTKQALKEWIRKPVPTPTSIRKEAIYTLETLQTETESKDIIAELLEQEIKAQSSTYQSFRKEEYWRIKSRSLWLKVGDQNTSFFHRQYRARLSGNHISKIRTTEGHVSKGFSQVKVAADNHFKYIFSEGNQASEGEIKEFLSNIPYLISPKDNAALTREVTEEEIIKIIWSMESDKAPGPNGFTIHFYKDCWNIIKRDLQKTIKGFMRKSKIGGGTNSTYLALIPKESNPETFARFRPISLCNASYKILAKLLASRIKPQLKKLISSPQGGFV